MKQIWLQHIQMNSGGTYYFHPQSAYDLDGGEESYARIYSTEALSQLIVGATGSVKNLRVDLINGTHGAGEEWTVTVRKNGVATVLQAVLSEGETSETIEDNFAVSPGDKISIQTQVTGSPTTDYASISMEYDTGSTAYSMVSGGSRDAAGTIYNAFGGYGSTNNTVYDSDEHLAPAPLDFTIRAVYVNLEAAPGVGKERGIKIRRSTTTLVELNVTDNDTEASSTGLNISVSAGDLLGHVLNMVSGPAASKLRYSVLIEADVKGESYLSCGFFGGAWADTYVPLGHGGEVDTGESERKMYCGPTGFILKKLYQRSDTIAVAGSRDATVYKNGIATALTCTIPGGGNSANDTSNTVTFDDGDYGSVYIDTTNDTEEGIVNMVMYIPPTSPQGLPLLFAG